MEDNNEYRFGKIYEINIKGQEHKGICLGKVGDFIGGPYFLVKYSESLFPKNKIRLVEGKKTGNVLEGKLVNSPMDKSDLDFSKHLFKRAEL